MLAEVHEWVAQAGDIALRMRRNGDVRRKADRSIVTAADVEIETLLRSYISRAYPNHGIIGEEQGGSTASSNYLWALDPIDGTSAFSQGLPIWGVSVGLLHRGVPVLGCFYMPLLDEWYEVDLDGPALFNGEPIEVATRNLSDSEAWICVPSNVHRRFQIDYPGKVRVLGSIAAYIAYVARGVAVGALIGRAKLWDIAAMLAVLERAGGEVRDLNTGLPLDLQPLLQGQSTSAPFIVGSLPALDLLQGMIRQRA